MKRNSMPTNTFRGIFLVTASVLFLTGILVQAAPAMGDDRAISRAITSFGLQNVEVTGTRNIVRVQYLQQVSEFSSLHDEAKRLAEIARIVNGQSATVKEIRIRQIFDDGQILEFTIQPKNALAFLKGQMTEARFLTNARMTPLTRGFAIVPGICEPGKGLNCKNCEACICYPNEACRPADPRANQRGCVVLSVPSNAHVVGLGSEYVCNDGYQWNKALTECIRAQGVVETPVTGKTQASTTWSSLSTGSARSIIKGAMFLESIPPNSQGRKNTFSRGNTIYVWVETRFLNAPHKLEIVWVNPSGQAAKHEAFELKGWNSAETVWSEMRTRRDTPQGQWSIKLLVDGNVDRAMGLRINP
jgi:hypothetical protein